MTSEERTNLLQGSKSLSYIEDPSRLQSYASPRSNYRTISRYSLNEDAVEHEHRLIPPFHSSFTSFTLLDPPPELIANGPVLPVTQPSQANEAPKSNSGSLFLMIFLNFLSNVMFSIVLPTLPSYIASVGGNVGIVGWAVSVNSFGTFLFSPIMGLLADRIGFRWVFLGSLVLMFGGSVWYSLSPDIYQLLAARFIVGAAAANFAPAGAYLSYASQSTSRTKIMAWNSAATVLGFICGPAFSLLTSFQFVEFHIGFVHFDSNTAPGYISAVLSLIAMFCLIPFQEISKTQAQAAAARQQDQSFRSLRSIAKISQMKVPMRGIVVLLFNCFVFTAAFTVFETTGSLYTKYDFDWDNTKTSILYLGISLVCLVALMSLQAIVMCAQEHVMMIVFMFVMTLGMGLFINWNAYVSFPVFLVAVTLVSIGYADSQALLLSIFAALLDSQEQGLMMGWLSSSSSVARMICPPAASYTYQYLGVNAPNIVFIATTGLILVSDVLTLTTLKHLKVGGDKKKEQRVFGGGH